MNNEIVAGGSGNLERVVYDLALRDLDRQEGVLNELRTRGGTVLTASSILASFLGGQAIRHSGFGWLTWVALVAFITSVVLCVWILMSRQELRFAVSGKGVYEALYDYGENLPEVHRRMAYWTDGFYSANQKRIDGLVWWYRAAAAAVVVEGILWAMDFRWG